MKVKIKKTDINAFIPTKGSAGAGAYDLYAPHNIIVNAHSRNIVNIGIAIELPQGYVADIRPRSGYSAKGFASADDGRYDADVLLGTIDSDYRGDIGVIIRNNGEEFMIGRKQRIAQMLIHKSEDVEFVETEDLTKTEREQKGYGSSGN